MVGSGVIPVDARAGEPTEECEFPAQTVTLERGVNITNTAPVITDIATDICGNVIGYTETMTRSLSAGEWRPAAADGDDAQENEVVVLNPNWR